MSQVLLLLRLKELDLLLKQLDNTIDTLPQKEKLTKIAQAKKTLSQEHIHLVGKLKDLKMDIEDNRNLALAVLQEEEDTQVALKEKQSDYKALKDFELKLSNLAKKSEKLDFEHVSLKARLDELTVKEAEVAKVLDKLQTQEKALIGAGRTSFKELVEKKQQLSAEREKLMQTLTPEFRNNYERARKRYGERAIETLEGNRPTACRVALQLSSMADLKRAHGVTECPYCHRILILPDALDADEGNNQVMY